MNNEGLKLGSKKLSFNDLDYINLGGNNFIETVGLLELIFKERPDLTQITDEDRKIYYKILEISGAHRTIDNLRYKGTRGFKYQQIIKPLLQEQKSKQKQSFQRSRQFDDSRNIENPTEEKKSGSGLDLTYNAKSIQYVYFENINELIDRLRLLVSEKGAGNNIPNNEILSIIEELKEKGVISHVPTNLPPRFEIETINTSWAVQEYRCGVSLKKNVVQFDQISRNNAYR